MSNAIDPNAIYTPATLAAVLGVGRKAVSLMCTQKGMRHAKVAKQILIPGRHAIEFVESESAKQTAKAKGAAS